MSCMEKGFCFVSLHLAKITKGGHDDGEHVSVAIHVHICIFKQVVTSK